MKTLILIPARGGSKSIPNKNMKDFCGYPLIYWAIKTGIESGLGDVCLSTDSDDIRNYALSVGALAPFIRPKELAEDETPTEPVIMHAIDYFLSQGYFYEQIILLQPTSPFRRVDDLIEADKIFCERPGCTSVISVREAIANENPHWMLVENPDAGVTKFNGDSLSKMGARRQDLPKVYIRNDYVYCMDARNFKTNPINMYGRRPSLLISTLDRVDIDINTPADWLMAELLFKHLNK
jgi:CMP-N,N'-diacetyllegionaminic acid synthase